MPRRRKRDELTYFYPAGFLSKRKPVKEILKAFRGLDRDDARLVVKGQVERELDTIDRGAKRDPRVEVVIEDLPTDEHLRLFASADICVAPSRWEGLGLHLYEAMALGLPVITNDNPPMNEVIRDGENGLLVAARRRGQGSLWDPRLRARRCGRCATRFALTAEPGKPRTASRRRHGLARAPRVGEHRRGLPRAAQQVNEEILERTQRVELPIEEVFGLYCDAFNLERITPPWLNFRVVTPEADRDARGNAARVPATAARRAGPMEDAGSRPGSHRTASSTSRSAGPTPSGTTPIRSRLTATRRRPRPRSLPDRVRSARGARAAAVRAARRGADLRLPARGDAGAHPSTFHLSLRRAGIDVPSGIDGSHLELLLAAGEALVLHLRRAAVGELAEILIDALALELALECRRLVGRVADLCLVLRGLALRARCRSWSAAGSGPRRRGAAAVRRVAEQDADVSSAAVGGRQVDVAVGVEIGRW